MSKHALHRHSVAYAAQNTEYTDEEVEEIVETIQSVMAPKLAELYYDAWIRNKQNYLANLEGEVHVFGFPQTEWLEFLSEELTPDEVEVGVLAHQYQARNRWEFLVHVRQSKLADHYPLFIRKEGDAEMGEQIVGYQFARMMKHGMSPAELVDHWLCENQNWNAGKVARWRGISREAVNKNVRQAKEKFGEYDDAVDFYEEKNIEHVPLRELDQPKGDAQFEDPEPDLRSLRTSDADE